MTINNALNYIMKLNHKMNIMIRNIFNNKNIKNINQIKIIYHMNNKNIYMRNNNIKFQNNIHTHVNTNSMIQRHTISNTHNHTHINIS